MERQLRPARSRCRVAGLAAAALLLGGGVATAVEAPAAARGAPAAPPSAVTPPARPGVSPMTADGRVAVLVELEPPPAVEVWAAALQPVAARASGSRAAAPAAAAARRQLATIERAQRDLVAVLESRTVGATVLYRVQRVLDGVAVEVLPDLLDVVRRLPGVRAVHPLAAAAPALASTTRLIAAPEVWGVAPEGVTGRGVRIGIVDSGVDYLHATFAGPGTGYADNDGTTIGDVRGFPGSRVVGGWDFVGDAYDGGSADAARRVPRPDPDPMDCRGHGTSVAAVAAGSGVLADGTTYPGPHGTDMPFGTMRIGSGVAPEAEIYALRVFGCEGTTRMEIPALEWAVDPDGDGDPSDHLDVVTLSIGGAYLYPPGDPVTVATGNAALAGVAVVRGADNDGDTYFAAASESDATLVVAASADRAALLDGVVVTSPPALAGIHPAAAASAFPWSAMAAPLEGTLAYPAAQPTGCHPFTGASAALLAGNVALLDWTDGECSSRVRADHAVEAGATGVVLALAQRSRWIDPTFSGSEFLPLVAVEPDLGAALKAALAAGVGVRFDAALLMTTPVDDAGWEDVLADFSARGPRQGDGALRPDVTAPGITVTTARGGSGAGAVRFGGTSCAAPHAAGALALLRQLRPTWSNRELKALLMNTASHALSAGGDHAPPRPGPARVGAGRIDLAAAAASEIVAFADAHPERVSLSFGVVDVAGAATLTGDVRVVNKGAAPVSVGLAWQETIPVPGVEVSLPGGGTLAVPAGGSAVVPVTLTATAAAMKHTRDATVAAEQGGLPRHWLSELAGDLVLTPAAGPALRLPVHALPRPASTLAAAVERLVVTGEKAAVELPIAGSAVHTGDDFPLDERSWLMPLELQAESPDEPASAGPRAAADLRWVGVASDAPGRIAAGGSVEGATVWFGVATHAPWSTPNAQGVSVLVDVDRDGAEDIEAFTGWIGSSGGSGSHNPTDVFVVWTCTILPWGCWADAYLNDWPASAHDTVPFATDVMYLPVRARRLGLTEGASRFDYRVRTWAWTGEPIDATGRLTYDPAHPGLDLGGGPYFDAPGALPVAWDRAAFRANGSLGVLLLHHHNVAGSKAEVVPVHESRQPRRHLRARP